MSKGGFIRYVGPPQIHDGEIVAVERDGDVLVVGVRGEDGASFDLRFDGVVEVDSLRPEGMILYSLTEVETDPPYRRFVFANTDEEAEEHLEVIALSFDRVR